MDSLAAGIQNCRKQRAIRGEERISRKCQFHQAGIGKPETKKFSPTRSIPRWNTDFFGLFDDPSEQNSQLHAFGIFAMSEEIGGLCQDVRRHDQAAPRSEHRDDAVEIDRTE